MKQEGTKSDTYSMITIVSIAGSLAVMGAVGSLIERFGADSREGFDERL
jgi:hypothetical protein